MKKKILNILLIFAIVVATLNCVSAVDSESLISDDDFETPLDIDYEILDDNSESIDDESILDENFEYNNTEINEDITTELNTTGIVMSDDSYSCGAASFATVLNKIGINLTLNEAKEAVNTTIDGTTMEGIINGANKYNLTAYGISVNTSLLNENYIVHLSINGTEHWSVVKEISQNHIILADSSMGNINLTKEEFNKIYTNNSIIISKSYIDLNILKSNNIEIITDQSKLLISGKAKWITKKSKTQEWRLYKWGLKWRWVYKINYYAPQHMGSDYIYVFQYSKPYKWSKWYKVI